MLLWAGLAVLALNVDAAGLRDVVRVTAEVRARCVMQATRLDFGRYEGTRKTASGGISIRCNKDVPYNIALDAGTHYTGQSRSVAHGADRIGYRLYKPDGKEWGDRDFEDTYPQGSSLSGIATGAWQAYSVQGVLPPGIVVPAGRYTDTVIVTVHL